MKIHVLHHWEMLSPFSVHDFIGVVFGVVSSASLNNVVHFSCRDFIGVVVFGVVSSVSLKTVVHFSSLSRMIFLKL